MKILGITQARLGSSRLPNKILKEAGNKTLLEIHINRAMKSKFMSNLVVATTDKESDNPLAIYLEKLGTKFYRGSESDVLDRFYQIASIEKPDYVVRLTSDCPLIDSNIIDGVISYALVNDLDYCSNGLNPTFPDGMDVEVFKFSALRQAWEKAELLSEREHVTPYIWKNSTYKGGSLFVSDNYSGHKNYGYLRLTVDEEKDYKVIQTIIQELGTEESWLAYSNFYKDSNIKELNSNIQRNEGYSKSINLEKN